MLDAFRPQTRGFVGLEFSYWNFAQPICPNEKIGHWTCYAFNILLFSTKNIRLQLHGDAELTSAPLHPHHARLAPEGVVFEI